MSCKAKTCNEKEVAQKDGTCKETDSNKDLECNDYEALSNDKKSCSAPTCNAREKISITGKCVPCL